MTPTIDEWTDEQRRQFFEIEHLCFSIRFGRQWSPEKFLERVSANLAALKEATEEDA